MVLSSSLEVGARFELTAEMLRAGGWDVGIEVLLAMGGGAI
jgi:hypothetical protein